jgi:hypothetical protein
MTFEIVRICRVNPIQANSDKIKHIQRHWRYNVVATNVDVPFIQSRKDKLRLFT